MAAGPCDNAVCARHNAHFIPVAFRTTQAAPLDPFVGQLMGQNLLVQRIGAGGFGAVYLGLRQPLGVKVAVKVLQSNAQDVHIEALFAEAKALATLHHPNIVRVLDFGTHSDGKPYLAMEYVASGRTLEDAFNRGISREAARGILRQLSHALEAAHAAGIVHRDLKPANVMLQDVEGDPYFVRLVDFGIAKHFVDHDSTAMVIGTPRFMAPEQFVRRGIGPWTDFYALGMLACALLLGRMPFGGQPPQAIMVAKCRPDYDPTNDMPGLRPPERAFVQAVLSQETSSRPANAASFLAQVDALLRADAELAQSVPVPPPIQPPSRKARTLIGAWIGFGIAAAIWLMSRQGASPAIVDAALPDVQVDATVVDAAVVDAAVVDAAVDTTVAAVIVPDARVVDAQPDAAPDVQPDAAPKPKRKGKKPKKPPVKPPKVIVTKPPVEPKEPGDTVELSTWGSE